MEEITFYNQSAPAVKNVEALVDHFLFTQDVRQRSRSTYRNSIGLFLGWVNISGLNMDELTPDHILAYKRYNLDRGLAPLTVSNYITVVRLFFKYCEEQRIFQNIAASVKLPKRQNRHKKQVLSQSEGKALLQYFEAQNKRDKAISSVLLFCGLRTIELSRLLIQDMTMQNGQKILKIHGKGHDEKDRFVPLVDDAAQSILDYLNTRPKALPGEPLFASNSNNNRGKKISTTTVSTVIKKGLRAIGIDDPSYTAHSLRHTFAVSLLKTGADIYQVQKELGHTSISTTEIYTRTITDQIRLENPVTNNLKKYYS